MTKALCALWGQSFYEVTFDFSMLCFVFLISIIFAIFSDFEIFREIATGGFSIVPLLNPTPSQKV